VVLVARRVERLEALARELGGQPKALVLAFDLAEPGASSALRRALDDRAFRWTASSGAGLGHGPFETQPPEAIRACSMSTFGRSSG
jgi:short-subunit dehydrogenase